MNAIYDYKKLYYFLIVITIFALLLSSPVIDWDVLIYSVVGRGIYEYGKLPYQFAFDHKPIVTYYLYGFIDALFPDNWPKFQFGWLAGYMLTAFVISKFTGTKNIVESFFVFLLLTVLLMGASPNTEVFFTVLSWLSIYLLYRSQNFWSLSFAGFLAAIAFNINYLAFFLIAPVSLYLLLYNGSAWGLKIKGILFYALGFAISLFVIFLPFILTSPRSVISYFTLQANFLSHYSDDGNLKDGLYSVMMRSLKVSPMILIAFIALFTHLKKGKNAKLLAVIIITFLSSIVAAVQSMHFYPHYFYPAAVPLAMLFLMSENRWRFAASVLVSVAVIYSIWKARPLGYDKITREYNYLKETVKKEPVLSIRSSVVPIYFSNAIPFQPYIFIDHVNILYGPREDNYYLQQLQMKPRFVILGPDFCTLHKAVIPLTCRYLGSSFSLIHKSGERDYHVGYDLYSRVN